jgi:hypothetical protein
MPLAQSALKRANRKSETGKARLNDGCLARKRAAGRQMWPARFQRQSLPAESRPILVNSANTNTAKSFAFSEA